MTDSTIAGNHALTRNQGGGLTIRSGKVALVRSTITGNSAIDGGGVFSGGISAKIKLTVTDSTIAENTASSGGSTNNEMGSSVTVTRSTISGNTASSGGGMLNGTDSKVALVNSTVSRNGNSGGFGGGLLNQENKAVVVTDSTITGNNAKFGGGILSEASFAGVKTTLKHAIVAGNTAQYGAEIMGDSRSPIMVNNANLFGHQGLSNAQAFDHFTPGAADIVATSNGNMPTALPAVLNPTLADNGGPTRTHALVPGSPALDVVSKCPKIDQRGVARPQGAACDIGAFELEPGSPP